MSKGYPLTEIKERALGSFVAWAADSEPKLSAAETSIARWFGDADIVRGEMVRKRKIICYIATSADGFIARADGSVDWLDRPSPKGNYGMGVFYKSIDTILWGRKTCDMALDFQKKGVPGSAFDARVKNYVFTRGPQPSAAPASLEFVNESIKAFTKRLRKQKGKDIWMMGGAGIIASFLDEGEIDEFMIHVIPTFIGEGIPLIAAGRRNVRLKLISCTKFADGVVKLRYAVRTG